MAQSKKSDDKVTSDGGDDTERVHYLKSNCVFNADQIEGLPDAFYHHPAPPENFGTEGDERLERFPEKQAKTSYAEEELVAEIASAMLGSHLAVEPDFEQNADYIKHWVDAMKADNRAIFNAAAEAQKVVDSMNDVVTTDQPHLFKLLFLLYFIDVMAAGLKVTRG